MNNTIAIQFDQCQFS